MREAAALKILVLSNLYPPDMIGGYELGCRQAVEALRSHGHEVRVLTSNPRRPVPPEPGVARRLRLTEIWSEYLYQKGLPVTAHLTQSQSHRIGAANVHALLDELEDFQPDVVYAWMLAGVGGLGLMACLEYLKVPWVWHLMDDLPLMLCRSAGALVPTYAREFERLLGNGRFLACSQQLVDEIEAGGIPLGKAVEVVPNWYAGPIISPRSNYLEGGRLRIAAAAGQIDRRGDKGIDLVIESAALLRDQGHSRFHVDIYGNVVDPYFPDLILARGLREFVTLKGPVPQTELQARFADYDLFAFPTRPREPFSFVALEASARGCVPLMTRTCGNAEWFVHGVHVLKAPRTAEAFARSFAAVLDGTIDLGPIGHRLAAVVRRDFHLDAIVTRLEHTLAEAADQPRDGGGTAEEAYRLALLAERLSRVLIQESLRDCA